jgi:hypothetical protein
MTQGCLPIKFFDIKDAPPISELFSIQIVFIRSVAQLSKN